MSFSQGMQGSVSRVVSDQTTPATGSADGVSAGDRFRRSGLPAPWLLVAMFALALLPMTVWFVVHHPDERHYTDAGIAMVQTGDLLTPRRPDGSLRFNKPILTYWCVAASYALLGIGPLASRLPFLLAGCGVIWWTYKIGKLIGQSETAGRWAALAAVGNLQIVLAATRSIPDILLCLFTTISCYGVLAIVLFQHKTWATCAAAYVGLGLAVASKGVPAVIVVVGLAGCAIAWRRSWSDVRRLLHWPTMTIGAVLAGGWFVAMYALHGNLALSDFAYDQVGIRFEATIARRLYHAAIFLGWTSLVAAPWIIPALLGGLKRPSILLGENDRHRAAAVCILGAVAALAVATSFCNFISSRYILPIVPLAAAWVGAALAATERGLVERTMRWLLAAVCAVLLAAGAALAAANYQLSHPWTALACGAAFFAAVAAAAVRSFLLRRQSCAVDFGLLKLAAFPLIALGIFHFLLPDEAELIAQRLAQLPPQQQPVLLVGKPVLAGKIRVYDRGRTPLLQTDAVKSKIAVEADAYVITGRAEAPFVDPDLFALDEFTTGIGRVQPRELLRAFRNGELAQYVQQRRNIAIVAVRRGEIQAVASRVAPSLESKTAPSR